MSLAGGDPRPPAGDFAIAHDPVWSPDGRALLITAARVRENPLSLDWWFVPLDGREAVPTGAARLPAVKAALDGLPPRHDWRGDVIFSDGTSLWSLPISADGRITAAPRRLTLGVDRMHDPSVSRANTMVFASSTVTRVIERVPLTGADAAPRQLYLDNRSEDGRASQTADGAVLVFPRDREIWLKDLRTGKEAVRPEHREPHQRQCDRVARRRAHRLRRERRGRCRGWLCSRNGRRRGAPCLSAMRAASLSPITAVS